MPTVPLQLPLKVSDAAALAELVLLHAQGRKLDNNLVTRIAARAQALRLSSIVPFIGSLQRDPDAYYVVADTRVDQPECWLLRLALASSPSSGLFPNAVLIGRMRTNLGHEVVVSAVPFGPGDHVNIRTFVERIDPAFLPKSRGAATDADVDLIMWSAIRAGWREGYSLEVSPRLAGPFGPGEPAPALSAALERLRG